MRLLTLLYNLPVSILLLVPAYSTGGLCIEAQWPYNLPPYVKYFPEDEPLVRRNVEIQNKLETEKVRGLRKMSHDEGEMFFLEYWQFEQDEDRRDDGYNGLIKRLSEDDTEREKDPCTSEQWTNDTMSSDPQPPLLLHSKQEMSEHRLVGRYLGSRLEKLFQRDFVCPNDTLSCSYIGQPNSCCESGLTCNIVPQTDLGVVGCCAGSGCSGQVAPCQAGYTACPYSLGGGCCIPGYVCSGVGCVLSSTTTVVVEQTVTVAPASSTSISITTVTLSTDPISTSTSTPTSESTSTIISSTPTSISTSTALVVLPPISCSSGFQSCPASLGGGCCTSGRQCGTGIECPPLSTSTFTTSSTITALAPVRPTSIASLIITTVTNSVCPMGFYQCSAYYNGGNCCQIGRDCELTSCPPHTSSTAIVSDGITIVNAPTGTVVPTGDEAGAAAPSGGTCATGWFACGVQAGGGCCPSGYLCSGSECLVGSSAAMTGAVPSVMQEAASAGTKRGELGAVGFWTVLASCIAVFWVW